MNIKQEVEEKIKTDYRNGEFEEGLGNNGEPKVDYRED
jgi:hypothetical protein